MNLNLPLVIEYVDGTTIEGTSADWPALRGDGVDAVIIDGYRLEGHSVYWLYWDEGAVAWAAGGASSYQSAPGVEMIWRSGARVARNIVTMPDLFLPQIKLGWWKRPKETA